MLKMWCTYKTSHPSGFYYYGKGMTSKVVDGSYKGSGVRWKLSHSIPQWARDTWNTVVIDTFDSEELAYEAEALLVPLELLADPYCMNSTAGGRKGAYQNHSTLFKKQQTAIRTANRLKKSTAAKEKKAIAAAKLKELKQKLKERNDPSKN